MLNEGESVHDQSLRHRIAVFTPEMAVGFGNKNTTVAMSLPRGDGLEINSHFNGARYEAPTKGTGREVRKFKSQAGSHERLFWISDFEHVLAVLNPTLRLQPLEERQELRKNRNRVSRIRFHAIECDPLCREIKML